MNCWNCSKDVPQIDGKKPKKYCNDACRMAYKRAQSKANKSKSEQKRTVKSEQALHPEITANMPGDDDYVCSQEGERICWRCTKPTPSPLLDTHLDCTTEARTIASQPRTAAVMDEERERAGTGL